MWLVGAEHGWAPRLRPDHQMLARVAPTDPKYRNVIRGEISTSHLSKLLIMVLLGLQNVNELNMFSMIPH